MTRIAFASDLHEQLPVITNELNIDTLVLAGDISNGWPDTILREEQFWIKRFEPWAKQVRDSGIKLVGIPGNHDFFPQVCKGSFQRVAKMFDVYVTRGRVRIDGLNYLFFCYNNLEEFAYYASPEDMKEMAGKYTDNIKTDFVVTHTPPYDILSGVPHWGAIAIRDMVHRVRPKIAHIFGHVHTKRGYEDVHGVHHRNVAYCKSKVSEVYGIIDVYDTETNQFESIVIGTQFVTKGSY